MIDVSHEGDVFPGLHETLEEPQEFVGVVVGNVAVWPEGQGLGANTQACDVRQFRRQQGLQVVLEVIGPHDHRIAAGDQQIGHFAVAPQVAEKLAGFTRREA